MIAEKEDRFGLLDAFDHAEVVVVTNCGHLGRDAALVKRRSCHTDANGCCRLAGYYRRDRSFEGGHVLPRT